MFEILQHTDLQIVHAILKEAAELHLLSRPLLRAAGEPV